VYCSKCGTKNEEDAKYCKKCGANLLAPPTERWEQKRIEDECFGLPNGGGIIGIIIGINIGIIIILVGIALIPGIKTMYAPRQFSDYIGPIAAILFGALILAGSLYNFSRRW